MKRILVALLLLFPFSGGCGSDVETQLVEGALFLDDSPVAGATITILPLPESPGEPASGFSDEKGRFALTSQSGNGGMGALPGSYRAIVSKRDVKTIPSKTGNPDHSTVHVAELLPEIYRDVRNSPLRIEVRKGKNKVRLELTKTPHPSTAQASNFH